MSEVMTESPHRTMRDKAEAMVESHAYCLAVMPGLFAGPSAQGDMAEVAAAYIESLAALSEIANLKAREFTKFPADWREQIKACPECQSYKNHPVQQGICDEHRRPLWARKAHDEHEQSILGIRAAEIARVAIRKATSPAA